METNEFIEAIERMLPLDAQEATQTLRVVLAALSDRLPDAEAHDLVARLPEPLQPIVEHLGRRSLAQKDFVDRIATDLGVDRREATRRTRAVYEVLVEAIPPDETGRMIRRLPPEVVQVIRPA
jgi:uncharacterized protein (DUF2267 family)